MKILIVYATTDGQTRKIARLCADRLADEGHAVELLHATDADSPGLSRFNGVILSASLHVGGFQTALAAFASSNAAELNRLTTLFLPVSLSAAGDDKEDWDGLNDCVAKFLKQTGWTPTQTVHVAGAFKFTEYDFFRAWAMRRIAAQKGEVVEPHADKEYTDWSALGVAIDRWAATLKAA